MFGRIFLHNKMANITKEKCQENGKNWRRMLKLSVYFCSFLFEKPRLKEVKSATIPSLYIISLMDFFFTSKEFYISENYSFGIF